ncbi:MAG: hypothetical protein ACF8R7_01635 [Phycisphaerales bacterium JB039]
MTAAPAPVGPDLDGPGLWRRAIELSESRQLRALLGQAEPESVAGAVALVRAGPNVAPMIEAKRAAVESLLSQAAGRSMRLELAALEAAGSASGAEAPAQQGRPAGPAPGEEHPLVRRAAELFGAKIVHVEPLARPQ